MSSLRGVRRLWLALGLATCAGAQPVLLVTNATDAARTSLVRRALSRAGLATDEVAPSDLPGSSGAGCRIAVVAGGAELTSPCVAWLSNFVGRGGKLIVFPPIPTSLSLLVGVAEAGTVVTATDADLGPAELSRGRVPALPSLWRQRGWSYQPITPVNADRAAGWWHGPRLMSRTAALTVTGQGAFVAAQPNGDDRSGEAQILLALATTWFPDLWHACIPAILSHGGMVGDAESLSDVRARLNDEPLPDEQRAAGLSALSEAETRLRQARAMYDEGRRVATQPGTTQPPWERYLAPAQLGWEAQVLAERAFCLAARPQPGEFRGAWIQDAGGIRGWGWKRTAAALAENGFKAVLVNVANGGYANYPSVVLPHVTTEGEDPLAEAIAACHAVGIECHAWIMCNFLRPLTPPAWRDRLEFDGRLQTSLQGQVLGWLRPSDERNRRMLADVAQELVQRYAIDGIHLDYVRWGGQDAGYGAADRAAFERLKATTVETWPADVAERGPQRTLWEDWRAEQVELEAKAISVAARAARPAVRVSAAVWPIWVDSFHQVGQQPDAWAQHGLVDFLCPMNYQTIDDTFLRYYRLQQGQAGDRVPLYPGIAAWRHESPADTVSQVRLIRQNGGNGFVLFHLDRRLAEDWLPLLHLGVAGGR